MPHSLSSPNKHCSKEVGNLLLGARTKGGLYPRERLPSEIETIVTTEDGSYGEKGKVTDILSRYSDWADQIYACGPIAMYQTIANQISNSMLKNRSRFHWKYGWAVV